MRRSATFIASALGVAVLLAACNDDKDPEVKESGYVPTKFEPETQAVVEPGVRFEAVSGIEFVHENGTFRGKDGLLSKYLPETMGSGVALFDYDNDDDVDILFLQFRRWSGDDQPTMKLFRNDGAWTFTDVTKAAGLDVVCYGMGAAVADYDADGDLDLYVTCLGPNLLFRNGAGRFARVAGGPDGGDWVDEKEQRHPSWTTGAAWFDADGDGDLDLVTVSYVRWTKETDIHTTNAAGKKAFTRPQLYGGDRPRLYLQQDGVFTDATKGSGLDATKVPGKSMSVCVEDFNGDGKMDLFVANDTVQNFLLLNRGGGRFEDVAVSVGVGYDDDGKARAAMGVDTVDYRNDGMPAIAIGNFSDEPVSLFRVTSATGARGLLFQDEAATAKIGLVTLQPLTFGLLMLDADLDGWCDMVLANGHIEPGISVQRSELKYAQPAMYLRNVPAPGGNGGRRFADVSADAGGGLATELVGRGLAAADLDGDGDQDLVLTSNGGPALVLRSDLLTKNRALRVRLHQPGTKNLDALGAVVRVTSNGITQRRVVRTGGSYLSQGERTLSFGVGDATEAVVEVTWPDGIVQKAGALKVGFHKIRRVP